jgi:hypothetical protein
MRQRLLLHLKLQGNKFAYKLPLTKVFAKAGLDFGKSATCKHQQRFPHEVQFSALVHNFNNLFQLGICTGLDNQ